MKSKGIIIALVLVVVAAVAGYFVFRGSGDTYCRVIPKDAALLARIDMKTLVADNDIDPKALAQKMGLGDENTEIGLDFASPVYVFASVDQVMGVVAAIDDADKLEAFLNDKAEKKESGPVEEQRGYKWVQLDTYGLMVWDGDILLAMSGKSADQLRNTMADLMAQDKDASIMATKMYEESAESKESLSLIVDGKAAGTVAKQISTIRMVAPMVNTDDIHLKVTLAIKDNKATLATDILPQTDAAKGAIEEMGKGLKTISGDLIDKGISSPILWVGTSIDGEKLSEELHAIEPVHQALTLADAAIDVNRILKSLDGDMSLALDMNVGEMMPHYLLNVTTNNTDYLKDVEYWKIGSFDALASGGYVANIEGMKVYLGESKKGFYLASDETLGQNADKEASGLSHLKKDITDSNFYLTVDLQKLLAFGQAEPRAAMMIGAYKDQASKLDRFTIKAKGLHTELELSLKEGNNLVKTLEGMISNGK